MSLRRFVFAACLGIAVNLTGGSAARAGDLTVFIGEPRPGDAWGRAYGVSLTATVVPFVGFEGEASRISGSSLDTAMTAFTGSAVLSPPMAVITPYGGVGVGLFRQTIAGGIEDTGRLTALFGGLKFKTASILVLKAEYRRLSLSGNPPIKVDGRFSIGAGVVF